MEERATAGPAGQHPGEAPAARGSWTTPHPGAGAPPPAPRRRRSFLAELPVLVLIAFVLALLLKTFLVQAFFIPSSSMEPTLEVGDRVLVNKVVFALREPRRGEVVVFTERAHQPETGEAGNPVAEFFRSMAAGLGFVRPAERDFIKRIMGLPGETIEMRGGVVYADGVALPEAPFSEGGYLSQEDMNDFGPVDVPDGEYFMMGDNRPHSADSRFTLGTIPAHDVVGRAFVVIWPPGRVAGLPIADYAGAISARAP